MKNLSEKALLVNLNISQWSGRAYDEEITMKVERDHSAINAGRYTKILIAEEALREPQKAASAARKFYHKQTLPWTDNGDRILPAENYFRFMREYQQYKSIFDGAVILFIREYPTLKAEAKSRLNGMFKDLDYPDTPDIKSKFKMKIGMLPINNIDDFRLKVNAAEVQHLRSQMEEEISSRITEANRSLWLRVKEAVGKVAERLSQDDAVFRNSLIDNVQELIDLIPRLNFTEDDELDDIVQEMKPLIVDPEDIREDARLRHQKAEQARTILDKVNDFLG
jgi:hypothetical protein